MSVLLLLVLIIVGAAGAVGTMLIVTPKLFGGSKSEAQAKEIDRAGKIAVPISARAIEAYTAVQNEDLISAQLKDFAVSWVDERKAKEAGFLTDIVAIRGRVMARDKGAGYAFTEADFKAKGTRPGPAAAVEPGMRGVWIDPARVPGIENLRRNDRFDLTATIQVASKGTSAGDSRFVSAEARRAADESKAWQTTMRILVKNGMVIVPVPQDLQKRKGKQVFVQVSEAEAEPLSEALAVGAELVVYLRSGQPGGGQTDLPSPDAPLPMDTIEIMQGGKSIHVPVPAKDGDRQEGSPK